MSEQQEHKMIIVTHEQRSPEWHEWRKGGIGGSDAATLIAPAHLTLLLNDAAARNHPIAKDAEQIRADLDIGEVKTFDNTPWKLWALKKELIPGKVLNPHMLRGVKFEDTVRQRFEDKHNEFAMDLCAQHPVLPFVRVSFDGVLKSGAPLEIKCPAVRTFEKIKKAKGIMGVTYYYPQVQMQIGVAGTDHAFFYACFVDDDGNVLDEVEDRVERNDKFINAMFRVFQFYWETYVLGDIEPPLTDLDIVSLENNEGFVKKAREYVALSAKVTQAKAALKPDEDKVKALKGDLEELSTGYARVEGGGVKITRFAKQGDIDYVAALAALAPHITPEQLEPFRKAGSNQVKVTINKPKADAADNASPAADAGEAKPKRTRKPAKAEVDAPTDVVA